MQENNNSNRIGVYINNELLARCDAAVPLTDARSRSEFICDAIEYYIAAISVRENSKVLTPALESAIGGKIALTEDRISRILFKLGVEVAMMSNIIAATHDIDEDSLSALRRFCTNEVAAIGGKYSFEDAVEFQNG